MKYTYKPSGVCTRQIDIEMEGDLIQEVVFTGGCAGNTTGIASLIKGQNIDEVISRLEGIRCGFRPTSCPDQLAKALKQIKNKE